VSGNFKNQKRMITKTFSLDLDENNMMTEIEKGQVQFIADIKEKVRAAQYEALKIVNVQLINLYWYLVQFYEYHEATNLQPKVGEITWSKHLVILSKCKNKL